MTSDILEGNFKIFIGKKSDLRRIDQVMNKVGITGTKKYFTADTTAKAVLTPSEMENGVALIDFGAGCTSVTIYHDSIMRHYASIPFGGKNITEDIKSESQISERLAENIKLAFGACMPEKLQSMSEKILHIRSNSTEPNMKLPVKYLSEIITARVEEIMMAILYEIYQSGYADSIRSGIVVTGGCAQMANLGNYIYDISGYRVRTGYAGNLFSYSGCEGLTETSATASLGLLLAAKDDMGNCAQGEENVEVAAPEIYNPFDFPVETVPAVERFTTDNLDEQENAGPLPAEDPVTETEDVTPIAQTYQEPVQRTIFRPEEIETVPKKPKEKNSSRIRVFWKKISETAENLSEKVGSLYDNVNQDIDNENV